jgi:F-type H+-transporting ATPase subunit delta
MKITTKQYAKTLYEITYSAEREELPLKVAAFIKLLRDQGQLAKIELIKREFESVCDQQEGLFKVFVTSVQELNEQHQAELRRILAAQLEITEEKLKFNYKVDPAIKGGLVVRVGNLVVDASIRAKMNQLKGMLIS